MEIMVTLEDNSTITTNTNHNYKIYIPGYVLALISSLPYCDNVLSLILLRLQYMISTSY